MKSLLTIVFTLSGIILYAGIQFVQGDFQKVLQMARDENKLIFIDVYTEWCAPCKKLDAEVFALPEVGEFFNTSFINYKLDAEEETQGIPLSEQWSVHSYPTLLFLDANGQIINKMIGFTSGENLILSAQSIFSFLQYFEVKINDLDKEELLNILQSYPTIQSSLKTDMILQYWNQLTTSEKVADSTLFLLQHSAMSLPLPILDTLVRNIRMSRFDLNQIQSGITMSDRLKREARNATIQLDQPLLYHIYELQKILYSKIITVSENAEKDYKTHLLDIFYHTDDTSYAELAKELMDEYILIYSPEEVKKTDERISRFSNRKSNLQSDKITTRITQLGIAFLRKYEDSERLQWAIQWLEFSAELKSQAETYLLLASLYHKTGQIQKAGQYVEKASLSEDFEKYRGSYTEILQAYTH